MMPTRTSLDIVPVLCSLEDLMTRFTMACAALLLALTAGHVAATGDILVPNGFLTGQKFLDASETTRTAYSAGLVDGFLGSALLGGPNETAHLLHDCLGDMRNDQVSAIFEKYLRDNPAQWTWGMTVIGNQALRDICPAWAKTLAIH